MTGAPMPAGADAVVMVERSTPGRATTRSTSTQAVAGRAATCGRPAATSPPATWCSPAGTLLRPGPPRRAGLGRRAPTPLVVPRPRVGVLSTGDELVDDDRPLGPGQIRESQPAHARGRSPRPYGVDAVDLGHGGRRRRRPRRGRSPTAAAGCDAVVTSGGVSMGDFDLVKVVLDELADMRWMQVAIRPAKPFAFGVLDGTPGVRPARQPGVVAGVASLLGVPGLRRLAGRRRPRPAPGRRPSPAPASPAAPTARTAFLRVRVPLGRPTAPARPTRSAPRARHQLAATAGGQRPGRAARRRRRGRRATPSTVRAARATPLRRPDRRSLAR